MTTYEPPRITFVGSDPKIPALKKAINRVADVSLNLGGFCYALCLEQLKTETSKHRRRCLPCRFVALWQARNRRVRVIMWRVRQANRNAA